MSAVPVQVSSDTDECGKQRKVKFKAGYQGENVTKRNTKNCYGTENYKHKCAR